MARLPAGVRKRKNGSLEKRFTIKGVRYSVYGNSIKEINTKEQEIRNKIEARIYTDNRNVTIERYYTEWLNAKRNTVKSNTMKTYSTYYRKHIAPALGKKKIQQLERRELVLFQSSLAEGTTVSTANFTMKVLKIILNEAVNDEIIARNPAIGIKALKDTKEKAAETYHRALTKEEQKLFMEEAESEFLYEFLAFLLCSGMRSGEAAALSWKDIDTKAGMIHITKTLSFTEEGIVIIGDSPKTEAGKRDIPLTDTLKRILKRQRQKQRNVIPVNNTIFFAVYGGLVHNHAVNRAISATLERLEEKGHHIEHFTAHALRDTYATRYIEQNGKMQTLKKLLGHSSLAMTMDLYAHVLPDTKQQEASGINFDIAL